MSRRQQWIINRIPAGTVALPRPGHAWAGFVTFGPCDCSCLYRDAKWFIDCAGHLKFSKLRRFIEVHHEHITKDEWWKRKAAGQ